MADWDGKSFSVQGRGGHIYSFKLIIKPAKDPLHCNVAAVDMRFVLPEKRGEAKPIGHAVFCEEHDPEEGEIICRNSWGSVLQHIRIPYRADYILGLY